MPLFTYQDFHIIFLSFLDVYILVCDTRSKIFSQGFVASVISFLEVYSSKLKVMIPKSLHCPSKYLFHKIVILILTSPTSFLIENMILNCYLVNQ